MLPFISSLTTRGDSFSIWTFSDAHVSADTGRLAQAVGQIDSEEWNIALELGDSFRADRDNDTEGSLYVSELDNFTNHDRSDVYSIMGNHDATDESNPLGANHYFQKYVDPAGNNPATSKVVNANRPYTITSLGSTDYASYYLTIGNMLIIMLGDRNDGSAPMGEDGLGTGTVNFRASGGLTTAEWNAFTSLVENNTDKIIIVGSHQSIRDTTIGMAFDEFYPAFYEDENLDYESIFGDVDEAKRAGYIAYIDNVQSETTINNWITTYGQYIDLWIHGHYHRKIPNTWAGKTRYEEAFNTRFLNVSVINSVLHNSYWGLLESKSNIIEINGNVCTVKTYIHYDPNSVISTGFYAPEEFSFNLKRTFRS